MFAYYPEAWRLAADLELPTTARIVLLRLADVTNAEGVSWHSQASIAKATGLSVRTVSLSLKLLEAHGLIIRQARFDEATNARTSDLVFLRVPKVDPPEGDAGPPEGEEGATARLAGKVAQMSQGPPAGAAEKPRIEPLNGNASHGADEEEQEVGLLRGDDEEIDWGEVTGSAEGSTPSDVGSGDPEEQDQEQELLEHIERLVAKGEMEWMTG